MFKSHLKQFELQLLKAIEALHMQNTGASDCLSEEEVIILVSDMKQHIKEWVKDIHHKKYDTAVRYLLLEVLDEYETKRM
jgi:hypothetical protein